MTRDLTASAACSGLTGAAGAAPFAAPAGAAGAGAPASGTGFLIFFFPLPGPALAFLLGGGGLRLDDCGVAAAISRPGPGAASILVEMISP